MASGARITSCSPAWSSLFRASRPHVDSIRPGHCMDSIRPSHMWILYVPLVQDVPHRRGWTLYVLPTCGFYTSWPFGLHASQSSADSIYPAQTGRPTCPTRFMDSVRPTHVWILYVQGPCGSCMSVAFEPECQTLESSLRSLYGWNTSWSRVDSIHRTLMDSILPGHCVESIHLDPGRYGFYTSHSLNGFHTSQPHVHSKRPAHTGPTRPGHCMYPIHLGPGHCVYSIHPIRVNSIHPSHAWILYVPANVLANVWNHIHPTHACILYV